MEESDLLKERLQAITEKHRIQEVVRQKKLELDQEKFQLQHLKKKALREKWLLQDSASHNATGSPQQQSLLSDQQRTKALQLHIHRLKAVERSPEEIIKEAQENFVPEPLKVTTEPPSPPADNPTEPMAPRKTLFAMEINVSKNLLTGQSTVLSTASVPPEQLRQHTGLKVYDDGRKSVYALNSRSQGSHDLSCRSELSAREVEQLLRGATVHRRVNQQNYQQNYQKNYQQNYQKNYQQNYQQNFHQTPSRREEHCFYNHQDEGDNVDGRDLSNQGRRHGNNTVETSSSCRLRNRQDYEHHSGYQEGPYCRQEERRNLKDSHRVGNHRDVGLHHGNLKAHHYSSNQGQEGRPSRSSRSNGCPTPRSHDQEAVSAHQPQLCYTPANQIPLSDYISVDTEELYCYSLPPYHSALYGGPAPSDRVPSPLCGEDTPYTIINAVATTEPITAIFMGFQTAQDDSGRGQEFEGSLRAELVVIEDGGESVDDGNVRDKKSHSLSPPVCSSVGGGEGLGDRQTDRRTAPGIKRIPKNHKACCTVC
ncbi:palmdelphin isoform X2 [Scophthalmus maximus]|uniref:palmdelphin isoform X2 n=1 Tax=Scophthalmus maximus TaxID=52904 RepID=UPI001FA8CC71|nr:palmdelphin isoform X2 [Scophthalmus maximus]